ncbi:hypothetical protein [Eubacterium sp. AB3007]|uniref:hypothetical protein n=1 Tax=Eubacterium sp. AB3007 TaxID=1392487 RepID=UPI000B236A1D|nr:hypothetical protein [Eubacterium sp. AB3007]
MGSVLLYSDKGNRSRKGIGVKRERPVDGRVADGPSRLRREAKGGGCGASA